MNTRYVLFGAAGVVLVFIFFFVIAPTHEETTIPPRGLEPDIVTFLADDHMYGMSWHGSQDNGFVVVDADKFSSLVTVQDDKGDVMGKALSMGDFGLVPGKRLPFGTVICRGPGKTTPRLDPESGKIKALSVEFEPRVNGNPLRKNGVIIKRITFEVRLVGQKTLWLGLFHFEFEE